MVDFGTNGHLVVELLGHTQTVAQIVATNNFGIIENRQDETGIDASGMFVINGASDSYFNGLLRDNFGGTGVGVLQLVKDGAGTLTLEGGSKTYSGDTQVDGGTLLLNSTLTASDVTVTSGGTLGGVGTVVGSVTVAGALAPGASAGTLTAGSLTMQDGVILNIEHDAGAYDQMNAGSVLIEPGAMVTVDLSNLSGTPDWDGVVVVAVGPASITGFDAGNWTVVGAPDLTVDMLAGGVTLVSSIPDDQDGDGLPDAWEQLYFGDPTNADANADSDVPPDGQKNIEEYIAGTDPTNSASYFKVEDQARGNSVVLSWSGVSNRLYNVESTTDLYDTNSWVVLTGDIPAVMPTTSYTNATVPDAEHMRINVKLAP